LDQIGCEDDGVGVENTPVRDLDRAVWKPNSHLDELSAKLCDDIGLGLSFVPFDEDLLPSIVGDREVAVLLGLWVCVVRSPELTDSVVISKAHFLWKALGRVGNEHGSPLGSEHAARHREERIPGNRST